MRSLARPVTNLNNPTVRTVNRRPSNGAVASRQQRILKMLSYEDSTIRVVLVCWQEKGEP